MASWSLAFRHPYSISLESCEAVLSAFTDEPATVEIGVLEGNPRELYTRPITITGARGALRVTLTTSQAMRGREEYEPHILSFVVGLDSATATFAAKLAAWRALADAFERIGCRDETLRWAPAAIVEDAIAAGDSATAARLRGEIEAARVEEEGVSRSVAIQSPRTDVEAILAAVAEPERIVTFSLIDCGLTALPSGFARFPNLEHLYLDQHTFDGSVLRGLSLPRLTELTLHVTSARRIEKADLAGCPALRVLNLRGCWLLESLDPELIDVCPSLSRVYLQDTPLWENERARAELRARWPRMVWRAEDGYREPPRPKPKAPPPAPVSAIDPTLRPFFDGILAAPDDDGPRLVLADFLTERGDRRGEQIVLACELAKHEPDEPGFQELAARCQVMPQFSFFSERRYPFLNGQRPGRGFVDEIECAIPDFIAHAEELMEDAPIRGYLIHGSDGQGALLATSPSLARLRSLDLRWLGADDRAAILASPQLRETLRELTLSAQLESAGAVAQLARDLEGLKGLRRLALKGTLARDAVDGVIALVEARGLERLDVTFATLDPPDLIETLWDALGDDRLRPRRVLRVPFERGVLSLTSPLYSVEQIRALMASGAYRSAVTFALHHSRHGDAVVELLATSRAFPSLVELRVGGSGLTDAGVAALASKAVGLDALARIELGLAPGGREPGGVSDAAVEVLARSPRLPALERISRSIEHHVYTDGARDDTEVVELRRADGRVVQSVIGHFIWP